MTDKQLEKMRHSCSHVLAAEVLKLYPKAKFAIGPAIEVFSQFETVLDVKDDSPIKIREYLDFVDQLLVKFSLGKALEKEETSFFEENENKEVKFSKYPVIYGLKFKNIDKIDQIDIKNRLGKLYN